MAGVSTEDNDIDCDKKSEESTKEKLITPQIKEANEGELHPVEDKNEKTRSGGCCSRYSPRQWTIFLLFCVINLFSGSCYSLQAPFYPKLALSKGASASVYGFVFGVFELVNCIACFIYGKNLRKIGAKPMLNWGNAVQATCCILFGFLDKAPAGAAFISLSFSIRIVEALGQSAYLTASYATIAREFPDNVATTFSILETAFALGMVLGPAAGGFMYEIGGYVTPFAVAGSLLLSTACVTYFLLPQIDDPPDKPTSLFKLLTIPAIAINYYAVTAVAYSLGFTYSLLTPHLEQFNLTSSTTGIIFMINGGTYALSATPWALLSDRGIDTKLICATGGVIIALSFVFLGPVPFVPIKQDLWLLIVALVFHGIGGGAEYVSAFLDSSKEALLHGFPDNIETYGLVSGLWVSGLSLGSFLGPSVCGVMYDAVGFGNTALVVVAMHFLVAILSFTMYRVSLRRERQFTRSVKC